MRFFFAIVTAGLVIAAVCGLANTWDGSYYLFRTLDSRVPYVTHQRVLDFALSAPSLAASYFTADLSSIRVVFGLSYILLPLASLAACWWIVRKRAPALFVWPALGIGIGMAPGMLSLTTEANEAVELFWPVLLSLLIGMPRETMWLAATMTVLTFFTHPTSAAILAFGAVVAIVVASRRSDERPILAAWAQGLALLAIARYVFIRPDSYEQGELSLSTLTDSFKSAVEGTPLWALTLAWIAGVLIIVAPFAARRWSAQTAMMVRFYGAACAVVAGMLLIYWAQDPSSWGNELSFKGCVLAVSVPFFLLATADALAGVSLNKDPLDQREGRFRVGIAQAAGVVLFAVLAIQGTQFAGLTDRLRQELATSKSPCLGIDQLPYLQQTGLNHWSLSSLALLVQPEKPRVIVLFDNTCKQAEQTGRFQLINWDSGSSSTTWFDLSLVRSRLAAQRTAIAKIR